ncbi:MmgE/PrpD family protein [Streptomyces hygroscopicus]|uniref:MmgE/PrpD family protein n=1 Tax=Streptomyces hygroscopicus TaxID=1912 RepID=UPI0018FED8B5|nr:MmgE/PrpD family protein [Streptomyces hygroscopicus]
MGPALFQLDRSGGLRGGRTTGRRPGAELIAAVAAGQDLFARLRGNVGWRKDWNLSAVLGVFAATAAAGRVMGLPGERLADALGIASMVIGAATSTPAAPFRALAARHRRAAGGAAGGNVTRQSPAWFRLTRSARCSRWYARPARRRPG